MKPELIIILGPTASGKSALAIKLAKKFNGEVISADSRQVYRGLNLASGKISKKEMAGIPHHCLDIASLKTRYTVARWKKCAESSIEKILKRGKLSIVVGGTAFYINALINTNYIPEIKPNWKLRKILAKKSVNELFKILKKLDPRRAETIEKDNPRRLIRAIEIIKATGRPVPELKLELRNDFNILILGINRTTRDLAKRINKRLAMRLKAGMISEVRKLHASNISWRRLEELGLEPRWIAKYLQNKISKSEMEDGIARDSHKFVRHQMTWWKKDKKIRWISLQIQAEKLIRTSAGAG
ncbi:MAG: tRNA (adenosine(37)-N6)-dimethylallyltransferase MiaA [Patescibacteria group bacterium]